MTDFAIIMVVVFSVIFCGVILPLLLNWLDDNWGWFR